MCVPEGFSLRIDYYPKHVSTHRHRACWKGEHADEQAVGWGSTREEALAQATKELQRVLLETPLAAAHRRLDELHTRLMDALGLPKETSLEEAFACLKGKLAQAEETDKVRKRYVGVIDQLAKVLHWDWIAAHTYPEELLAEVEARCRLYDLLQQIPGAPQGPDVTPEALAEHFSKAPARIIPSSRQVDYAVTQLQRFLELADSYKQPSFRERFGRAVNALTALLRCDVSVVLELERAIQSIPVILQELAALQAVKRPFGELAEIDTPALKELVSWLDWPGADGAPRSVLARALRRLVEARES